LKSKKTEICRRIVFVKKQTLQSNQHHQILGRGEGEKKNKKGDMGKIGRGGGVFWFKKNIARGRQKVRGMHLRETRKKGNGGGGGGGGGGVEKRVGGI